MAIEKMATTKKLRQTEDKKTEKTPKQQKKIRNLLGIIHAFVEHVFFAAGPQ
jgi:hypothetical protein